MGYLYVYRGPPGMIDELAAVAEVPPQAQPGDLIEPIKTGMNLQNLGVLRDLKLSTGYMALVPASVLDPNDPLTQRLAGVKWRWNGTDWFEVADRCLASVCWHLPSAVTTSRAMSIGSTFLNGAD